MYPDEASRIRDQYRGCLLGGAVGDALGAPVEFLSIEEITKAFGPEGITDFAPAYGRLGAITDDTQMTLFTVEGFIRADIRFALRGICDPIGVLRRAYERWLVTQGESPPDRSCLEEGMEGWLFSIRELHARRAPGNTCLSALKVKSEDGSIARNDSKGCGGVMRVAPLGLIAVDPYDFGCKAAHITHGHPLGWQSAGAMALLISKALNYRDLRMACDQAIPEVQEMAPEVASRMTHAARLADSIRPGLDCIEELGAGWVAEEALAIGLLCALRGKTFEEAVVLAVNHSGDSDSTGSITGQLWGTAFGASTIPTRWLDLLELRKVIERAADDLYDLWDGVPFQSDGTLFASVQDDWWNRYPGF